MEIEVDELKDASIERNKLNYFVRLKLKNRYDYVSTIMIPTKSYDILRKAIIEDWLEEKKSV